MTATLPLTDVKAARALYMRDWRRRNHDRALEISIEGNQKYRELLCANCNWCKRMDNHEYLSRGGE